MSVPPLTLQVMVMVQNGGCDAYRQQFKMEEDQYEMDSVVESAPDQRVECKQQPDGETVKSTRQTPVDFPAMLFTNDTVADTISTHLKGSYIRDDRVVVWLRRANIGRLQAYNFQRALDDACRGFGIPITIQDGATRFSWHQFAVEFLKERIFTWLFIYFIFCFVAIGLLPQNWAFPVAMSIWTMIVGAMARRAYLRAFFTMDVGTARNHLLKLISSIRCKEDLYAGVSVIHCGGAFWRNVVRIALSNAEVALVDVTKVTEHLTWELEQSMERLNPEGIILLYAHCEGVGQKLPKSTQKQVSAVIGDKNFHRCQVFTYPASYGPLGILNFRLFQKVKRKLTLTIATAIVACVPKRSNTP